MLPIWMRTGLIFAGALLLAMLAGCGDAPEKTDAELGLNAQQASGRRVYQTYCAACHKAYSSSGMKGPGLKRLFRKPFLPSGLPANDRFVRQSVVGGRGMMPPLGDSVTEQQLSDLLAYLHTL
jgi:mono/diheme cytochrome c family protein